MGLFKSVVGKLKKGLDRTRDSFVGGLRSMLRGRTLDDALIDDLERALIQADVGVAGFTAAGLLGVWLIVSILMSKRF